LAAIERIHKILFPKNNDDQMVASSIPFDKAEELGTEPEWCLSTCVSEWKLLVFLFSAIQYMEGTNVEDKLVCPDRGFMYFAGL
jgi:hypothetical protein